ncbi:Calcium-binding mitochondrial carrier protein [Wickerhamomyces ciferrii]|uniref:Calcium-binding mitochondrial carrier protein n=1 Tax=Wickerhamomyces ciferrii (strain ATCC 14091 / BCRC 22168 / CBS 111 / JCM 3599 / NBRC 0793 / NRRL Y-1031 F-60-10) TaxID=1206466 RepID=K0KLG4_WICCF|nr:Calcium-binding mitochondrial carrier protein [Wickerhamomyces ciferrii]CCH43052.1 Calcium-binding mitochondrial carrier protein [Wickerhamomyces ciferrii]
MGCTGKTIEYPFDTIKVRLQSQPHDQPLKYLNTIDCIKKTYKSEGFHGFYRGLTSPIIGAAAENACLFVTYNLTQDFIKSHVLNIPKDQKLPLNYLIVAGGFSGIVASFILTPIELVKCKIQVEHVYSKEDSTILKQIKKIYKQTGIKGFWFGQTGTLLRECGGTASWFGSYEFISYNLKKLRSPSAPDKIESTIPELLISGASAGIMYNLSLFPADTIKSKMQTSSIINPNEQLNFIQTGLKIYKYSGFKGFYTGLGITLTRAIPSNAVIFFTYEQLKKTFT